MLSSSPKTAAARALASSVLPTPVGPKNRNEPIGRFGSCRPTRPLRIAFATALTASSCPITLRCRVSSSFRSRSLSRSVRRCTGTLDQREITPATSSAVTSGSLAFPAVRFMRRFAIRLLSSSYLARIVLAAARSPAATLSASCSSSSSSSFSSSVRASFFTDVPLSRTAAQASSMTSIALSGRFRSVI